MVYGHVVKDTVGNEIFVVDGCSYCQMSTGGAHQSTCPYKEESQRRGYEEAFYYGRILGKTAVDKGKTQKARLPRRDGGQAIS